MSFNRVPNSNDVTVLGYTLDAGTLRRVGSLHSLLLHLAIYGGVPDAEEAVRVIEILRATRAKNPCGYLPAVRSARDRITRKWEEIQKTIVREGNENAQTVYELERRAKEIEFDENEAEMQHDKEVIIRIYGLSRSYAEEVSEFLQERFGHLDISVHTYDVVEQKP